MVMLLPSKSRSPLPNPLPNPKLSFGKNPLSFGKNPLSTGKNPLFGPSTTPCSLATLPVLTTCWTGVQRLTLSPVFLMVVVGLAALKPHLVSKRRASLSPS
jgi:hypothetical protein